jgi:NAD(P)H-dependent flavin oxidoreductase YrpB (nitropropane dioxygenase family)
MGPFQTNKLAVAVANAGALGILSTSGIVMSNLGVDLGPLAAERGDPYQIVKKWIYRAAEAVEDGVFGINVMVSAEMRDAAKEFIRAAVDAREEDGKIRKKFRAIITSAGDPVPWKDTIKSADLVWLHVVPSVRAAKRCEKAGVDVVIASGHEAGGHTHWEPVHTIVLVPAVVEEVNIPVVAAGGFADGAGLAAALALGAVGIQMGTRFIATQESDFVQMWKNRILKCGERDSIVARGFVGPLRYLKNRASLQLAQITVEKIPNLYIGQPDTTLDPDIFKIEIEGHLALTKDDEEKALFYGGEVAGRIKDIPPVKELVERIVTQAEGIIKSLPEKYLKN